MKFAMIATGRIAQTALAPALGVSEGAELWSVLSRDANRAAEFAARHGARAPQPAYSDLETLLADPELDAVVIASPDGLHAEQTIASARAGKHVLVEKPMATDRASARAMVEACEAAGVTLGVAYHVRWHVGHRMLKAQAQAGRFGTLRHMRLHWSFAAPDASNWRASDAMTRWWGLSGVGTHCLDQLRWFLRPGCGEIVEVRSLVSNKVYGGPHDETAVVAFEFESGATGEICTSVLFAGPRRMEIYGSEGYAVTENTLGPSGDGVIETHEGPLAYEPGNPYVGEVEDFVNAVRDGRPPEVDGREGERNIDLLLEAIGD